MTRMSGSWYRRDMETTTSPAAFADYPTGPGLWVSIALTQYEPSSPIIPTTCMYRVVETENGLMDTRTDYHWSDKVTVYRALPDPLNPEPTILRSVWWGPVRNGVSDLPSVPTAYMILALQDRPNSVICLRTVKELKDGTTDYRAALERHPNYLPEFRRVFPDVDLGPLDRNFPKGVS